MSHPGCNPASILVTREQVVPRSDMNSKNRKDLYEIVMQYKFYIQGLYSRSFERQPKRELGDATESRTGCPDMPSG